MTHVLIRSKRILLLTNPTVSLYLSPLFTLNFVAICLTNMSILTLTTLAERRMRGDLIEAFKIIRGFVDYGQNLFKLSVSGLNILSKITKDTNDKVPAPE